MKITLILAVLFVVLVLAQAGERRRDRDDNDDRPVSKQAKLRLVFKRLRKFRKCLVQRWSLNSKWNCVKKSRRVRMIRKCMRKVNKKSTTKKEKFASVMKCISGRFKKAIKRVYGTKFGGLRQLKKVVLKCEERKCDDFEGRKRFKCVSRCVKKHLKRQAKREKRLKRKEKHLQRKIKDLKKKMKVVNKGLKKIKALKIKLRKSLTRAIKQKRKIKEKRLLSKVKQTKKTYQSSKAKGKKSKKSKKGKKGKKVTTIIVNKDLTPYDIEDEVRLYLDVVNEAVVN
jgi:hypothetical protein